MKEQNRHYLAGKNVLITGGTTGIGRAAAIMLAEYGARVMIIGRHRKELDQTISAILSLKQETHCWGMVADLALEKDIERIFGMVDSQFQTGLNVLINNAALPYQSVLEGTYKDWQYVLNTNLLSYLACSHEGIKRMPGKGHIVNIGSMSADVREQNSSVYVATKSGVQGFSEALRKEVNPMGIKVTLIEPGATNTPLQKGTKAKKQAKVNDLEMLHADEVARAIVYCLSQPERSDVVNLQIRPHLQLI